MADTPNSALGTNEKMDDTDIALVKAMYCGKFDYFTFNYRKNANNSRTSIRATLS